MFGFGQIQSSSVAGGSPVEPAQRWFCDLNPLDYIDVTLLVGLAMTEQVTLKWLVWVDDATLNTDMYSDTQNLVYTRWRAGSVGTRLRWGGAGPNFAFGGLATGKWFSFEQTFQNPIGSGHQIIHNLTDDIEVYNNTVTGLGSTGTITDFIMGIGTDKVSNGFDGMIANFKVYNALGELTSCWRIDDNDTIIANQCGGSAGTLTGSTYTWQFIDNPIAGQPMGNETIATTGIL